MARAETTPWARGTLARRGKPRLLFGRMFEDWAIEKEIFPPAGRIFCIASAGCTALALSGHGFEVVAADINPVQIAYVQGRLAGDGLRQGRVDDRLAFLRRGVRLLGWSRPLVRAFLDLDDPRQQARMWATTLATRRFRLVLAALLHPRILGLGHAPEFVNALPRPFAPRLQDRLARGAAGSPNRRNPYAWRLMSGEDPPGWRPPAWRRERITLACDDAAAYLERCRRGTFDAFTLSNILDAAPPPYMDRLMRAVAHAARPGAVAVLRSLAEPVDAAGRKLAARDRAWLWGDVRVLRPRP